MGETVLARHAVVNKWYEHQRWGRVLCCGCVNPLVDNIAFAARPKGLDQLNGEPSTVMKYLKEFTELTPLPDCTGWDWKPPTKYRPFKHAWEFIEQAKSRKIMLGDHEMKVRCLDFCSADFGSTSVMLCDPSGHNRWYSFKDICDQFTFSDTNEPCGVKL